MAKDVPNRTNSISKQVKEVLNKRPLLVNALIQNIANYSALARYIQKELGTRASIEAIKTSLLREKRKLAKQKLVSEEKIIKLLTNETVKILLKEFCWHVPRSHLSLDNSHLELV